MPASSLLAEALSHGWHQGASGQPGPGLRAQVGDSRALSWATNTQVGSAATRGVGRLSTVLCHHAGQGQQVARPAETSVPRSSSCVSFCHWWPAPLGIQFLPNPSAMPGCHMCPVWKARRGPSPCSQASSDTVPWSPGLHRSSSSRCPRGLLGASCGRPEAAHPGRATPPGQPEPRLSLQPLLLTASFPPSDSSPPPLLLQKAGLLPRPPLSSVPVTSCLLLPPSLPTLPAPQGSPNLGANLSSRQDSDAFSPIK